MHCQILLKFGRLVRRRSNCRGMVKIHQMESKMADDAQVGNWDIFGSSLGLLVTRFQGITKLQSADYCVDAVDWTEVVT